jgi:hypothetical protein
MGRFDEVNLTAGSDPGRLTRSGVNPARWAQQPSLGQFGLDVGAVDQLWLCRKVVDRPAGSRETSPVVGTSGERSLSPSPASPTFIAPAQPGS